MLFTSWTFFVFLLVVLAGLHLWKQGQARKLLLLAASYFFYMWWNPALVTLILFSTAVDFVAGKRIAASGPNRRRWLYLSLASNLGLLATFKYAGFFQKNLIFVLQLAGLEPSWTQLNIILPVGISFYTFQTLSYTIDVYRGTLKPCDSPFDFALFVCFFPQLVAGPIVRAVEFLPQLAEDRKPGFSLRAVFRIVRGLFKKAVIADNLGIFVARILEDPGTWPSSIVALAVLCFSVQIYCDFSGYSEIAIGVASLLGYDLPENFGRPYFAATPSEFWRRWHISLSTWLRDYLYIPLGGNRTTAWRERRNLMITMLLGGLWHGASWNFVLWGLLHGLALVLVRGRLEPTAPVLRRVMSTTLFQGFVLLTWIAFAITDTEHMLTTYSKLFFFDFNFSFSGIGLGSLELFTTLGLLAFFWAAHLWSYFVEDPIERVSQLSGIWLLVLAASAGVVAFFFWPLTEQPFVYFQF